MSSGETKPQPNKPLALVLGAICGIGVGHFYAGFKRRALVWLVCANALVFAGAFLVVMLGRTKSFGVAFGLLLGLGFVAWAAPLADLAALPRERFQSVSAIQVVLFLLGSFALTGATRLATRRYAIEAFKLPSGSMAPTLLVGDHIFVDKLAYRHTPAMRGDLIVFRHPEHRDQDFVQRIVGMPGDKIEIRDRNLVLNGNVVPHCSLGKATLKLDAGTTLTGEVELERLDGRDHLIFHDDAALGLGDGPWIVGQNELFTMGDNRENSADARTWFAGKGGGLPVVNVWGKVLGVWMRFGDDGIDTQRVGLSLNDPTLPAALASLGPALEKCRQELERPSASNPP